MEDACRTDLDKKESSMAINQPPISSNISPPPGFCERENSPTFTQYLYNNSIVNSSSISTPIADSIENFDVVGDGVSLEEALESIFDSEDKLERK